MPDSSGPEIPAGRVQLGEYVIEGKLGSGGMGQVYRARQPSLDRTIALKVLPRSVATNRESVERFYREARNAARLVHPNIVQIYTVGEEKGVPYFAMEYVAGEDLERRMKRGEAVKVEEAVGVVASVAMALACAEEAGIVHRDVKPGNIMIDSHGVVKVTDFGLAKAVKLIDAEITQAGFIVGTPTYMSPEQAEGREVDSRSDIYSLGVVFYELLCGRPPFISDDPATLIYMHVHKPPDPPRGVREEIPEAVERACLKCLAKKSGERYQGAAELLADLVRVQEAMSSGSSEEGTIVFDRRMAKMLISSHGTRRPSAAAPAPSEETASTEPTIVMRGRAAVRQWPALAGGAAAVGVLLVAAILALLLSGPAADGPEGGASPGAVDPGGGGAAPETADAGAPAPAGGGPVLPFSILAGVLPEGAVIEICEGEKAPYRIREFVDQGFAPGPVTVRVSRPYYREIVREFEMKATGPEPEFRADTFVLEPDDELLGLVEAARAAVGEEDFARASQTINRIRSADPSAGALPELEGLLAERRAAWSQRWTEVFEKARKLVDEGSADEASALLADIPPLHQHYEAAQTLQRNISESRKNLREGRGFIEERLRKGAFGEARSRYEWLVDDVKIPPERLADLAERLDEAELLEKAAREADQAGKAELARAKYLKLAEIALESAAFRSRAAELEEIIIRGGEARKLVAAIEEDITRNAFARAREGLDQLRTVDAANAQIAEIDSRIRTLEAQHQIASFLGEMDKALIGVEGARLADFVDPGNAELSASVGAATDALAACAARFTASRFRLRTFDLGAEGAEADVRWEYALDVPAAGRRLAGVEEIRLSLSRRPQGWRVASVTAGPGSTAKLLGGGEEQGRIQGRVTKIEGGIVNIDRGASHGVKTKMVFALLREARFVKMPLVDKLVVVEEEKVCEVRVIEVRREDCLASFLGDTGAGAVAVGMLAVESPLTSVAAAPPVIKALRASRDSAPMGESADLELVVSNVDGVPACYLWEADGGKVRPARTTAPRAVWTAPRLAGEYTVRAVAVSPLGASRPCEAKIRGEGAGGAPAAAMKLAVVGETAVGAPFASAGDIAFDDENRAFVLDSRTLKLLVFSPEFVLESAGSPYRRGRPERVKAAGGHVYVLDSSRIVRRHAMGKDPFASPPGTAYGAPGQGNGKLLKPVDFALSPSGDVAVLDAGTSTIQVFGADGRFLASFGTKGRVAGELLQPKAIVADSRDAFYVLDVGRRQVLVFRKGGYSGEFPVGTAEGSPADLAYDAVSESLLVLDEKTCEILAYTTGGVRLPASGVRADPALASTGSGLGTLARPSRMVCDGTSHLYVIGGDRSENIDRWRLSRGADAPAAFAGRLSATVPATFTCLAASPAGDLYFLDQAAGLLWQVGPGGWITGELGGPGDTASWTKARDVATDASGDFYVLDNSLCTIRRFSPEGVKPGVKPLERFGRKEKPSEKDGIAGPVAVAGSPAGAASQVNVPGVGPADFVAVILGERAMGIHVFLRDGSALSPFPGTNDGQRQGSCVAIGVDGNVHVGSAGVLESWSLDGRLIGRRKLDVGEPTALAASADGTVYVLDAGRGGRRIVGISPDTGKVTASIDIPRSIRTPTDIACDGFGTLYLLDGRARWIYELRPAAAENPGEE